MSRIAHEAYRQAACLMLLLIVLPPETPAKERVQRRFDEHNGLIVSSVLSLTQDESGFIWIGTVGGLVRYDGVEMRPWARDVINRQVSFLRSGPAGEVLFRQDGDEHLYRVTPDGVAPLEGPQGEPLRNVIDATFDPNGMLWVLTPEALLRGDANHDWASLAIKALEGERIRQLRPGPGETVYLLTGKAIWQVGAEGDPRKVLDVDGVQDVISHPDGALYVLAWKPDDNGEALELREGRVTVRVSLKARAIDLALRRRVVWVSYDRFLVALRPGEPPELLGHDDSIPSGGPLLVDREGSLWLGTFLGLIQFPEPETVTFNDRDGLPSAHTRYLFPTEEGVWVSTWQGLGRIEKANEVFRVRDEKIYHLSTISADGDGALWLGSFRPDEVLKRQGGRLVTYRVEGFGYLYECVPADDGTLWLGTTTGLFRTSLDGGPPRRVSTPFSGIWQLDKDGRGRVWISNRERLCNAPAAYVSPDREVPWSCETIRGSRAIKDILQVSDGSLWMATECAGVLRLGSEGWTPIAGSQALGSRSILGLVPSLSGGVWVLGHSANIRVIERSDLEEGWEVVERLSAWHGFPAGSAEDVLEEPDGTLWVTTSAGVVRIPAEARRSMPEPPRVETVDLLVNGRRVALHDIPQLPYGQNQIELRFAAVSYRDRSLLRYQYRLRPDAAWTDSSDSLPHFRFLDLRPGRYMAEVRASLDGARWSAAYARFGFEVLSPWYLKWWVLALAALALAGAIYAVHRVRVAFLLRLERQRIRIAMDLHDEVGSGLGSIGILSGVMADDHLDDGRRKEMAREIAQTSGDLGTALSDIVWALGPGSGTLERLAYHLTEHAGRLFPTSLTTFSTDFPARWPAVQLSLAVRRNLQLIALEALHNAARHAQARNVVLGLKPLGKRWQLRVTDDGIGFSGDGECRTGLGLKSMKRRAEEIGADICWSMENGIGTTVVVTFNPRARDRRHK